MKTRFIFPLIIIVLSLTQGCALRQKVTAEKKTFLLNVRRPEIEAVAGVPECMKLKLCKTSMAYSGNQLVYRVGPFSYEKDSYNTFLSSPDDQITEIMSQWFRDAKLFECQAQARTITLEPFLDILCVDFQDREHPFVYVELHMYASTVDESCYCPVIILDKGYNTKVELPQTPYAGEVVEAMSTALTHIMDQIESDLVENLY